MDKDKTMSERSADRKERRDFTGDTKRTENDGRHRDRGRDRDRNRRRDRDRDKDVKANEPPVQGPIVLLKRPVPEASSASPKREESVKPQIQDKNSSQGNLDEDGRGNRGRTNSSTAAGESITVTPTLLLRPQSAQKGSQSSQPQSQGKPKSAKDKHRPKKLTPLEAAREAAKPWSFPHDSAITVINDEMQIEPVQSLQFFDGKGTKTGDYFVITAIGKPQTGKSAILSYLAGADYSDLFPERNSKQEMESFMYISKNNEIFVEMASVYNCAAATKLASSQGNLETSSLIWNLKLMRWALAVSNVVILVSDNLFDPELPLLMNSAQVIHPMESALGEGSYPEIVFVCNKTLMVEEKHRKLYQPLLGTIVGKNPRVKPNIHLLPDVSLKPDFEKFRQMKDSITNFQHYNRVPYAPLDDHIPKIPPRYSVYDWYSNATKVWEAMSSPNYFAGYTKLFP